MTQAPVQPGLAEMNARMQQWMNEKPQWNGNSTELKLNQNDIAIFQFASNGNDGDRLIKAYRSHIFGQTSRNGKRFNDTRYCMIQNGDGQECGFCAALSAGQLPQGTGDLKERMSMWLLVHQILHANMPQVPQGQPAPQWPIVNYMGNNYYMEEVNAWKVWHNSAWRESPWADICRAASMYQSLHNFTAQLESTGAGMAKRYKFVVLPNSAALPREYYEQAWQSLQPLPDMLRAEASRQLSQNPQATRDQWSQAQPISQNFTPGGMGMPQTQAWQPPATPAPTLQVPMTVGGPPPLATQPIAQPATFQPGSAPTAVVVQPGPVPPPMAAPVAPSPQPPAAPPTEPIQAVAAPVAPPAPPALPTPPVAPPAAPPAPMPGLPSAPPPPAPPTNQVEQAPDDGRRPMRQMF